MKEQFELWKSESKDPNKFLNSIRSVVNENFNFNFFKDLKY